MQRLIYTVIFYIALPLYFLRLIFRGFQNPNYLKRWPERLGLSNNSPSPEKKVLWIHAVSVGEVNASIPMIRGLLETYKNVEVLVTTTTPTGSKILLDKMGTRVKHQYMPIDLPLFVKNFLDNWNPVALIVLETEIWPNTLSLCNKRNIFTSLVNARLSNKSKQQYLRAKNLIKETLSNFDLIIAQYSSDAERFNELNADLEIEVCGNLKFDQDNPEEMKSISSSIRESWSDGKTRPTLIAASTHETEEEFVIESFLEIISKSEDALLIVVPRHPERFNKVHELLEKNNLKIARRSEKEEITPETQVLLGDTMGELNFLYSVSDVAFVGGSLIDHGGQNLLEPASLSLPLCSGKSLRNFQEIADELIEEKALFLIERPDELTSYFFSLASDINKRDKVGKLARSVFDKNRGALERINSLLDGHLNKIVS